MRLLAMHLNCIHFRSSVANTSVHWAEVMQLLASGRSTPRAVRRMPLASAADVIRGRLQASVHAGAGGELTDGHAVSSRQAPAQPPFPYSSCRFHHWYGAVWG